MLLPPTPATAQAALAAAAAAKTTAADVGVRAVEVTTIWQWRHEHALTRQPAPLRAHCTHRLVLSVWLLQTGRERDRERTERRSRRSRSRSPRRSNPSSSSTHSGRSREDDSYGYGEEEHRHDSGGRRSGRSGRSHGGRGGDGGGAGGSANPSETVVVKGLPDLVEDANVREAVQQCVTLVLNTLAASGDASALSTLQSAPQGVVTNCVLIRDHNTGASRGFAFITVRLRSFCLQRLGFC